MSNGEFNRPVSVDYAPQESRCEWCGKPAEEHLTAIDGIYHNRGGLFCRACGEKFTLSIIHSLQNAAIGHVKADASRPKNKDAPVCLIGLVK